MEVEDLQSTWPSNELCMCRLCLCSCTNENSVEIFFTNDLSLTVRIMACTGLEVCLSKENNTNSFLFFMRKNSMKKKSMH